MVCSVHRPVLLSMTSSSISGRLTLTFEFFTAA